MLSNLYYAENYTSIIIAGLAYACLFLWGWGGWRSVWEAGGGLYLPIGLFGVVMSPRSASHRPRQDTD